MFESFHIVLSTFFFSLCHLEILLFLVPILLVILMFLDECGILLPPRVDNISSNPHEPPECSIFQIGKEEFQIMCIKDVIITSVENIKLEEEYVWVFYRKPLKLGRVKRILFHLCDIFSGSNWEFKGGILFLHSYVDLLFHFYRKFDT